MHYINFLHLTEPFYVNGDAKIGLTFWESTWSHFYRFFFFVAITWCTVFYKSSDTPERCRQLKVILQTWMINLPSLQISSFCSGWETEGVIQKFQLTFCEFNVEFHWKTSSCWYLNYIQTVDFWTTGPIPLHIALGIWALPQNQC